MHLLLNWYKQHLFNSCVTAVGGRREKKKESRCCFINQDIMAEQCEVQKGGPVAKELIDVVEGCDLVVRMTYVGGPPFNALATK